MGRLGFWKVQAGLALLHPSCLCGDLLVLLFVSHCVLFVLVLFWKAEGIVGICFAHLFSAVMFTDSHFYSGHMPVFVCCVVVVCVGLSCSSRVCSWLFWLSEFWICLSPYGFLVSSCFLCLSLHVPSSDVCKWANGRIDLHLAKMV